LPDGERNLPMRQIAAPLERAERRAVDGEIMRNFLVRIRLG